MTLFLLSCHVTGTVLLFILLNVFIWLSISKNVMSRVMEMLILSLGQTAHSSPSDTKSGDKWLLQDLNIGPWNNTLMQAALGQNRFFQWTTNGEVKFCLMATKLIIIHYCWMLGFVRMQWLSLRMVLAEDKVGDQNYVTKVLLIWLTNWMVSVSQVVAYLGFSWLFFLSVHTVFQTWKVAEKQCYCSVSYRFRTLSQLLFLSLYFTVFDS